MADWFERWFQEDYIALYPNRDATQAQNQVKMVLEALSVDIDQFGRSESLNTQSSELKILDAGCGSVQLSSNDRFPAPES